MLYLLDANVLITANLTYYPLDQVPEFWGLDPASSPEREPEGASGDHGRDAGGQ